MPAKNAGYNDLIFINCPFDEDYMPILHALVYSVYRCGFVPQCALSEDDGSDCRLEKIIRCIGNCRYGIHDISRIETNANKLPRFNMPFELGIFFGAKRFGTNRQKVKSALIFERTKYLYQQYISDLNGIDTKAHDNDPIVVVKKTRDWLSIASRRKNIPGHRVLQHEYALFRQNLPGMVTRLGLDPDNMPFNEYCQIVENVTAKRLFNKE